MSVLLPLRGGGHTLVDADVGARFAGVPLWISRDGYVLYSGRNPYGAFRPILLHRRVLQLDGAAKPFVDHVNGNKLDNRAENLRPISYLANAWNTPGWKRNASGFKGVTFSRAHNRYVARIRCAGQDTFIGYFTDPVEAARAYDAKALELRGANTALNFGGGVRGVPLANPQRLAQGDSASGDGGSTAGIVPPASPPWRVVDGAHPGFRDKAAVPNVHLTGTPIRSPAADAGRPKVRACRQCGAPVESPVGGRPREVHLECKAAYTVARNRTYNETIRKARKP